MDNKTKINGYTIRWTISYGKWTVFSSNGVYIDDFDDKNKAIEWANNN